MSARTILMRVHNRTSHELTKVSAVVDHGQWTTPNLPPDVIAPEQTAAIESSGGEGGGLFSGIGTGPKGSIRYASDGGGELLFRWDMPFMAGNRFHQEVPQDCGLCFSGGAGGNCQIDLQLVPSARVDLTDFLPSTGGFGFPNSWPDEPLRRVVSMPNPLGDLTVGNASNGICGGMSYAAADYYLVKERPPTGTTNPPGGDPLFDYLVERLFDSFDLPGGVLTYYKYMAPMYPDATRIDALGRAWVSAHEGFPAVMAAVDTGQPCPLGLVMVRSLLPTELGHNHQVLAYAYQLDGSVATYLPKPPPQGTPM